MALTLLTAAAGAVLAIISAAGPVSAHRVGGREALAVRDSLGRNVVLPGRAEKVLSLQPEITRIVAALGAGGRLVGADYFILKHDYLFPIVFPGARDLPAVSNTSEDMNFEMVLGLDPDVIFVSPTELQMVDALQGKLKRPVVALASMGSFDKLVEEILLVGGILGREARASELAADFRARIASVRGSVSAIPNEKKPRVYLSFWGTLTRTPVAYEPVDAAGGVNCARGMLPANLGTIATVAQAEQILAWRPDIILVQGNYPPGERTVTTEGILRDKRFGSLPAVRNGRVFYTFGFWYWWDPALVLVETLYLAHLFHPEATGPVDLEKEANAIFKMYYGVEGAYSSLCRTLECGGWDER
jgi:iron complex transport system substrate-binding protein